MKLTPEIIWLLLSLLVTAEGHKHNKHYCKCIPLKRSMSCDGKNNPLNFIPKAPPYVTTVKLFNIKLGYITNKMVANLTYCNLTSLTMIGNNITGIAADAFEAFTFLKNLIWQQDKLPLNDLQHLFQNMRSELKVLSLKSNGGAEAELDLEMFKSLQTLTHLTLNLLYVKVFNATSLSVIDTLTNLDLSGNRIVSVIIQQPLLNVTKVNLKGNNLVEVPYICRYDAIPCMPRLRDLNLEDNAIRELDVSSLACLQNLLKLTLSRNRIEHLQGNVFAGLPKLYSLQITNLWALKSIDELAFNSSSLGKLVFSANPQLHAGNCHPETMFKYTPNLVTLDLSHTKLKLHLDQMKTLLLNLKHIEKLTLNRVGIERLPSGLFCQLKRLIILRLSGNYITSLNKTVFSNVTSIRRLFLDGNNIKIITEDFFPLKFRLTVHEINLANNPFTCTCDLLWFRTWMDQVMNNKSIIFSQYPGRYECRSPNVHRLRLKDFKPTVKSCTTTQLYSVILTISLAVCLVFTVASLVAYRYRWYILYWISLMRRRRQQQGSPAEIQYDCFVSYSNPDLDWVSAELMDFLEDEIGLHLCEHSRDFKAGMYIVDNVIEAIDTSRKTILVISNEYMKSDWCQFELQMALSSFLKKEIDIVVILLEQIKFCNVTSSLRALMVSTTYMEWSDDPDAKRLFQGKLKNVLESDIALLGDP